ncbi:Group 20 mite allergen-like protein (Arginine kinase-like) [Euroglyphus maynei]|uniref:Arginine kinase n=1 Tax=Euroglyphus maynei TaxID=6958 RepID=A0A1Y3B0F4_EURMA|nr:Group 20 mite allergen-like protein (Arginine kinase-like) [Euroglyphus maynei]
MMRKLFTEMQQDPQCNSMLKRVLNKDLFERLINRRTRMGSSLMDVIRSGLMNHDSNIGVYAPDPEAYQVFADLFNRIIEEYHGFGPDERHPASDFGKLTDFIDLDPENKFIVSTRIRCGRSVKNYPFNPCLKEKQYKELEQKISTVLAKGNDEELKGTYLPLVTMSKEEQRRLIDQHYLFKEGDRFLQTANACRFWPKGRGIFLNKARTFMVWINEEDHIRIISMQEGGNVGQVFGRLIRAIRMMESSGLEFVRDQRLGYLTFCPTNLGTTIRASVMIRLPKLSSQKQLFESTANKFNLQIRGSKGEHTDSDEGMYDISNRRRLGLTEYDAVMEMQRGVQQLIEMEKSMKK